MTQDQADKIAALEREVARLREELAELRRATETGDLREDPLHRAIVDSVPMGVLTFVLHPDDRLVLESANPAADRLLGTRCDDLIGMTFEEALPAVTKTAGPARYRHVIETGESFFTEHLQYEDERVSGAFEIHHLRTGDRRISIVFTEITERLKQEQERLRLLDILESTSDTVFMATPDGRVVYLNRAGAKLLGWSRDSLSDKRIADAHPPVATKLIQSVGLPAAKNHGVWAGETAMLGHDGREIPVSQVIMSHLTATGEVAFFSTIIRDLTEIRRAENILFAQRDLGIGLGASINLDDALELSLVAAMEVTDMYCGGIFLVDERTGDLRLVHQRGACETLLNQIRHKYIEGDLDLSNLQGQAVYTHGDDLLPETPGDAATDGIRAVGLVPVGHKERTLALIALASRGRDKIPEFRRRAVQTVASLIGEAIARRQAEDSLRASEELHRTMINTLPDAVTRISPAGRVTYASPQTAALHGYDDPALLLGTDAFLLVVPEQREQAKALFQEILEGERVRDLELSLQCTDGSSFHAMISGSMTRDAQGEPTAVVIVFRDVDEQRHAEAALVDSETRQSLVLRSLPVAFYTAHAHSDFGGLWVSEQIQKISGYDQEAFHADMGLWAARLHPEDRDRVMADFECLDEGRPLSVEYRWQAADGTYLWILDHATLVDDPNQERGRISGLWLDITEHKQHERRRAELEQLLLQSQKMEAIGRLAGGVAHDFNNLLTAILVTCELLKDETLQNTQAAEDLEQISITAAKGTNLVRQLLAFSGRKSARPARVDVNHVVTDLSKLLRRVIGENFDLRIEPCDEPALVVVDRGQLEQVVINLVVNATEAMGQGGEVWVKIERRRGDRLWKTQSKDAESRDLMVLAVRDSGPGMDAEIQERIFEPFFTTKETEHGTGLGLSIVYTIAQQAGGFALVESAPGEGTIIRFCMPLAQPSQSDRVKSPALGKRSSPQGTETVLVVEDDGILLRMVARILKKYGYTVLEAQSGKEAEQVARAHSAPIHLLIADVVLPDTSGLETAEQLMVERPGLAVLMMSGHIDRRVLEHANVEDRTAFIPKPFLPDDLVRKMRELLDDHRNSGPG